MLHSQPSAALPTRPLNIMFCRNAVRVLWMPLLLCAGCAVPCGGTKRCESCAAAVAVGERGECNSPGDVDCDESGQSEPQIHEQCVEQCWATASYYCCRVWQPIGHCVEPVVRCSIKECCHVVNFCAPEGFVGPPDVIGPGRFHPVPTHPVFEPEPMIGPTE